MSKICCITLDLESDHSGQVEEDFQLWTKNHVRQLGELLKTYNVPLSIFVVGNTLTFHPEIINEFEKYNVEFHLHSFSHSLENPDTEEEISKGMEAYEKYFGRQPIGYRAPEGRISLDGLRRLGEKGFAWDSSLFPSLVLRPRYFFDQWKIRRNGYVPEIAISVLYPWTVPFTLSWAKLMGWGWFGWCMRVNLWFSPKKMVFDMHLHDLWQSYSYDKMSRFWKFIYGRNPEKGLEYLEKILKTLGDRGYSFRFISNKDMV